jgi:serine/threonine protein phosphatase PrpC
MEMTPDDAFIIIASDGLWAHCTSVEAVELIYSSLENSNYRATIDGNEQSHLQVQSACADLQAEVKQRAAAKSQQSDDVGIVVITLSAFWEAKARRPTGP